MFERHDTDSRPSPLHRRPTSTDGRHSDVGGPPRDCGTLLVLSGPRVGAVIPLPKHGEVVLGRGERADVRFGDEAISRTHTRIRWVDGVYEVLDLASRNGTHVGERALGADPVELRSGDRLRLGPQLEIRFDLHSEDEQRVLRELYESSVRDPLTRLLNRRYFEDRLEREVSYAQRHDRHLAALMIDIDHFKRINDEHGHPVGDAVLRVVATCLSRVIRPEDVLARYGGEEFCIIGRGLGARNGAILGERIRKAIEGLRIPLGTGTVPVTVSVGVAELRPDGDGDELIAAADRALYRAKARGRNTVVTQRRRSETGTRRRQEVAPPIAEESTARIQVGRLA